MAIVHITTTQDDVPHELTSFGAALTYTDTGEGQPMLIFLHYWGGSARTWAPVISRLGKSVRCIAMNLRGWGGSMALDADYSLDAMAADVVALLANLKPTAFVLVGHSMGGKVAQIVAKRRPDGLRGLVLVAPAPPTPMAVPPEREQVIADTLAGDLSARRVWTDASMMQDISAGLQGVTVPVQIVVGDQDQVERQDALRAAFAPILPQTRFTVLNGVGHLSPLEDPAGVAEACAALLRHVG